MSSFPAIMKPSFTIPTTVKDNSIKSEKINGVVVSRPRYSRQLCAWELTWKALPSSDLSSLRSFYRQCFGGSVSFMWTDDDDEDDGSSIAKNVRFTSDLKFEQVGENHSGKLYRVQVEIEEV